MLNIAHHLYLSTAVRAPDEPPAAADPNDGTSAPAGDVPDAADTSAEAPAAPVAERPPGAPKWALERIGEETDRRVAVEGRLSAAERKAADLQAILDRMQASGTAAPAAQPGAAAIPPAAPAPRAAEPAAPAFEERVQQVVTEREAARTIEDVVQNGIKEFTNATWHEKAAVLAAVGAASPEFVLDVIAADAVNAHKIIATLADDPEKAAQLAKMDVRRRTAELTRMSMTEQAKTAAAAVAADPAGGAPAPAAAAPKAAASVSRAPAPQAIPRPVASAQPVDPTTPEGDAKMSDKEWEQWYKDKHYKRA
jgi:hypothetical protein